MFSLEPFLDLPLIWYSLIIVAVLLYVILDGFDLRRRHSLPLRPVRHLPGPDDEFHRPFLGRQ